MNTHVETPLFPLSTVLFPGGPLQLRIFEPRYLAMVRECTRGDSAFGVCLILRGREAGAPAEPAAVGTLARISDFYSLPDGLLGIGAEGGARFRVLRTRVREDGLLLGTIELWDDEPVIAVPPEYALLATILERLIEQLEPAWKDAPRASYDHASWVGFRLAELLPLDDGERQQLLELTDPVARLGQLTLWLPRFQRP
ncbi:MAG: LON peptidase substrate-binding domain-containing protein [Xanthomonadaceae bacterium]|nr:LON peptidase substrate-binding domain-containing protein [Xanthomonadaceae bacterium]MDE1958610.1 LON peptidase substrate-binding domain-containing protein [Xanthomonadaceae bacterium]MDE2178657.1 LON peptidase substrate-binding domain-containing protein [Xanthomonadaceae bacterium]MDE2245224.1 LON peptidase substrate-binding domain-containing protein [Xanthomonadaceae bacterium]